MSYHHLNGIDQYERDSQEILQKTMVKCCDYTYVGNHIVHKEQDEQVLKLIDGSLDWELSHLDCMVEPLDEKHDNL